MHGQVCRNDSRAYASALRRVEGDFEDPATALHLEGAERVAGSPKLIARLSIPEPHHEPTRAGAVELRPLRPRPRRLAAAGAAGARRTRMCRSLALLP